METGERGVGGANHFRGANVAKKKIRASSEEKKAIQQKIKTLHCSFINPKQICLFYHQKPQKEFLFNGTPEFQPERPVFYHRTGLSLQTTTFYKKD